jgi:hypothetical protein
LLEEGRFDPAMFASVSLREGAWLGKELNRCLLQRFSVQRNVSW